MTASKRRLQSISSGALRVAVLPFLASASEDSTLVSFVSNGIAVALKQFRRFEVVSPEIVQGLGSSNEARSKILDYAVEGAVSSEGTRVQISIRLIDLGECARTIWSERFVVRRSRLSQWRELVATRIVTGMDPVTSFFDGRPKQRSRSGATGLLLVAIPMMSSLERRKYEEAGRLINRALELEPDNAMAAAWAAFWQVVYFGQGWTQNLEKASAIAQTRARRAITLNPNDAETLSICGHVSSFLCRDYDTALHYFDRAQRLDPALEFPWLWSALTYSYVGEPGRAVERVERYRALVSTNYTNPWSQNISSIAYLFSGSYEKAVNLARPMLKISPTFVNAYKPLIASLGHLGRVEEAKPYVDKLLALEPNFSLERFAKVYPIKYESDREHYMKGLRLAGIPEH
jgi:tetratricopeptide (TPR) repeat protein